MLRFKVFVSSVQKELQAERVAIGSLLATDPFLNQCVVPRIFEKYPAPLRPDPKAYLKLLETCHIYILIIGNEYGAILEDGLSATHQEYRLAQKMGLPILVCVKSGDDSRREPKTTRFFEEVREHDHTYSRFTTLEELQQAVRERLINYIQKTFDTLPTDSQIAQARESSRVAALFERKWIDNLAWKDLDHTLARELAAAAENLPPEKLTEEMICDALRARGYLWFDDEKSVDRPTVAGTLLLAKKPSIGLLQARVQMDAFVGVEPDPRPLDSVIEDMPITLIEKRASAFVRRNSKQPLVVHGWKRIEQDPMPMDAVREAVVNAVAHRDYEMTGAKIVIQLFVDRLVVTSPGFPPGGAEAMDEIRSGKAMSRARNPLIVQAFVLLKLMEERGSGISRIRREMTENGYEEPEFNLTRDSFAVTLWYGTKIYGHSTAGTAAPEEPAQTREPRTDWNNDPNLSANERVVLDFISENGHSTRAQCEEHTKLSQAGIGKILSGLVAKGYLNKTGFGKGTGYIIAKVDQSPKNVGVK